MAYWLVIAVTLVWMKWKEGRVAICGIKSRKRDWRAMHKGLRLSEDSTLRGGDSEDEAITRGDREEVVR